MLKRTVSFLRGTAVIEVSGVYPETVFNRCAAGGVPFWGIRWQDKNTVRFKVRRADAKRALALGGREGCDCAIVRFFGLPAFLLRFRRRYALLVGLALSLTAVLLLAQFVLVVDVSGNERVPTSAILSALDRHGIKPGVFGPTLDVRQGIHNVLLDLPELAWLSINLHGTRAEVLVRESDPKPAIEDEITPASIVSNAAGIITRMDVRRGQGVLQEGETVLPGEVLISGVVDLQEPAYSQIDLGTMTVSAAGTVEARTWRTLTASAPLAADEKTYTGREKSWLSLRVLGFRVNFYSNAGIPYAECDKISKTWAVKLPGGELPFSITRETAREYTVSSAPVDVTVAEQNMRHALETRLLRTINGVVRTLDFQTAMEDGRLTATLLAECEENIGTRVLIQ